MGSGRVDLRSDVRFRVRVSDLVKVWLSLRRARARARVGVRVGVGVRVRVRVARRRAASCRR